jgi:anti-sigma regulatory factor (Ser/Thr protein kinase)
VRTARLVAVAVARRAGVADELLDEVRLAVGEACSRAVALHQLYQLTDLVDVEMTDGPRFTVRVLDRGPAETRVAAGTVPDPIDLVERSDDLGAAEPFPEHSVAVGMGLALLTGLVDDLDVMARSEGGGTAVRMSWPTR